MPTFKSQTARRLLQGLGLRQPVVFSQAGLFNSDAFETRCSFLPPTAIAASRP